jgi:hypothetical protein
VTTNDHNQVATNATRRANWESSFPRIDKEDRPRAGRSADIQTGFGRSRGR